MKKIDNGIDIFAVLDDTDDDDDDDDDDENMTTKEIAIQMIAERKAFQEDNKKVRLPLSS